MLISSISADSEQLDLYSHPPSDVPLHLDIAKSVYLEANQDSVFEDYPLKIAHVSDIHHYSQKLYDPKSPVFDRFSQNNEGRTVLYTKELLFLLRDELIKKDINILLVTGDLSVLGAEDTHLEVASIFQDFETAGIRVFLTTGNHDINNPKSFRITNDGTEAVDTVSPERFRKIYSDYGFSEAVMVHDETLSYMVELNNEYLLLSLDSSYYQDNFWLGYSAVGGIILPSLKEFIVESLLYANDRSKEVIVMSHHNLLKHYEIERDLSSFMIYESDEIVEILTMGGVKLALSGHIHKSDIKKADLSDSVFYGAALTSFAQYPHTYRLLGLGQNGAGITDYSLAYESDAALDTGILTYNWYIYYKRNFLQQFNRLRDAHGEGDALKMAEYFYLANLYSQQGLEEYLPNAVKRSAGARIYMDSDDFMRGFAAALPLDSLPSDRSIQIFW